MNLTPIIIVLISCGTFIGALIVLSSFRCKHIWEQVDELEVSHWWDKSKEEVPMYHIKHIFYKCTLCGIHKRKKFKY